MLVTAEFAGFFLTRYLSFYALDPAVDNPVDRTQDGSGQMGHRTGRSGQKIMTQADPETHVRFSINEMVDQVVIFFLAGRETSASVVA